MSDDATTGLAVEVPADADEPKGEHLATIDCYRNDDGDLTVSAKPGGVVSGAGMPAWLFIVGTELIRAGVHIGGDFESWAASQPEMQDDDEEEAA